jgi:hypothetical protein
MRKRPAIQSDGRNARLDGRFGTVIPDSRCASSGLLASACSPDGAEGGIRDYDACGKGPPAIATAETLASAGVLARLSRILAALHPGYWLFPGSAPESSSPSLARKVEQDCSIESLRVSSGRDRLAPGDIGTEQAHRHATLRFVPVTYSFGRNSRIPFPSRRRNNVRSVTPSA